MKITLNGTATDVPDGTSVAELLTAPGSDRGPGRDRRGVAIAINGEVIPRGAWGNHPVADGDVVELLTATQGG